MENQVNFEKDEVKSEKLTKSSRLVWNVLSPQLRQDQTYYIQMTELNLDDEIFSVSSSQEKLMMFSVVQGPLRMYDFEDDVQLAITYEFARDLQVIRRKVYSFLDWMGDIGGLAGALHATFAAAIIVFQYKAVISYVSNHVFLIRDGDELDSVAKVH